MLSQTSNSKVLGVYWAYIWPQFMKWNAWALTHVTCLFKVCWEKKRDKNHISPFSAYAKAGHCLEFAYIMMATVDYLSEDKKEDQVASAVSWPQVIHHSLHCNGKTMAPTESKLAKN